jgi:WD40 repeat protein
MLCRDFRGLQHARSFSKWGPPDGRLASASQDGTVRIWDIRTATMLAMFIADGTISRLVALPSGLIVAGDGTGAVHFLKLVSDKRTEFRKTYTF